MHRIAVLLLPPVVSDAILDGGLPYEMADDGGSAIWMAIDHINHHLIIYVG